MDRFALELVRDWMPRASHDLRSARLLSAADEPPLDTAIYHRQRAAEKSVKAWLQGQDEPFRKTHDAADLVKQASESDSNSAQLDTAAAVLTPYASASRYPGGSYEPMRPARNSMKHCNTPKPFTISCQPCSRRKRVHKMCVHKSYGSNTRQKRLSKADPVAALGEANRSDDPSPLRHTIFCLLPQQGQGDITKVHNL